MGTIAGHMNLPLGYRVGVFIDDAQVAKYAQLWPVVYKRVMRSRMGGFLHHLKLSFWADRMTTPRRFDIPGGEGRGLRLYSRQLTRGVSRITGRSRQALKTSMSGSGNALVGTIYFDLGVAPWIAALEFGAKIRSSGFMWVPGPGMTTSTGRVSRRAFPGRIAMIPTRTGGWVMIDRRTGEHLFTLTHQVNIEPRLGFREYMQKYLQGGQTIRWAGVTVNDIAREVMVKLGWRTRLGGSPFGSIGGRRLV